MTLTATESPATTGTVQCYDGTTALGTPVAASAGQAAYTTAALAVGAHSLTAAFTPPNPAYSASTSAAVPFHVTAPGIAIDQTITQNGTGTGTTPAFTTTGPRLLVAYTSSDGPATKQTTTVTGGGLTWTLFERADSKGGAAEIWYAMATGPLTGATVASTPKTAGYDQSLTVIAFTGASGLGAGATAGKNSSAPSISLTTTAAGSWSFAVGEDYTHSVARTLGTGQTMINQWVDTTPGETFWVQNLSQPTPTAGTAVTLNDTSPTSDTWNMAAAEVLPASS